MEFIVNWISFYSSNFYEIEVLWTGIFFILKRIFIHNNFLNKWLIVIS